MRRTGSTWVINYRGYACCDISVESRAVPTGKEDPHKTWKQE